MNVIYCPRTVAEFNHMLNLNGSMQSIMRMARARQRFKELTVYDMTCERCGQFGSVQRHHHKPVWVFALEYLLTEDIQTYADACGSYQRFQADLERYDYWHSENNLIKLCKQCHIKAHMAEDKQWKAYFEANYPVVFGIRRIQDRLNLLARMTLP